MVEYLHNNGVYPGAVVFDALKIKEMAPYLSLTDELLVIIKGFTDFTRHEVYTLIGDLEDNKHNVRSISIFSNVHLGKVSLDYFLYTGDLFYGECKEVKDGKIKSIAADSNPKDKSKKSKEDAGTIKINENPFIFAYKRYSRKGVRLQVYGRKVKDAPVNYVQDAFTEKVFLVDLFK